MKKKRYVKKYLKVTHHSLPKPITYLESEGVVIRHQGEMVKHGVWKYYKYDQDAPQKARFYKSTAYHLGKRHGNEVVCLLSMNRVAVDEYKNNKKHGTSRMYFRNILVLVETYVNNIRHGPYAQFNKKGEIQLRGHYKNGNKVGTWFDKGNIIQYDNLGNMHGKSLHYDIMYDYGEVVLLENYNHGVCTSREIFLRKSKQWVRTDIYGKHTITKKSKKFKPRKQDPKTPALESQILYKYKYSTK